MAEITTLTQWKPASVVRGKVLSLDLGQRTGWAVASNGILEDSGVHSLFDAKYKDFTDGERFHAFYQFLMNYDDVDMIIFEQVAGGTKGRQTVLYNGYRATLLLFAQMFCVPVVPLAVGTIKKAVTGAGNASKQDVIDCVRALGHPTFDDNEADAIAAFYAAKSIDTRQELVYPDLDLTGEDDDEDF